MIFYQPVDLSAIAAFLGTISVCH